MKRKCGPTWCCESSRLSMQWRVVEGTSSMIEHGVVRVADSRCSGVCQKKKCRSNGCIKAMVVVAAKLLYLR